MGTHIVQRPGIFTTPFPLDKPVGESYPSESDGAYPVLLYLCEIIIQEAGVGYQTGDEVVIEPSYGAAAVMEADNVGRVNKVKVTAGGEVSKKCTDLCQIGNWFQLCLKCQVLCQTGWQG